MGQCSEKTHVPWWFWLGLCLFGILSGQGQGPGTWTLLPPVGAESIHSIDTDHIFKHWSVTAQRKFSLLVLSQIMMTLFLLQMDCTHLQLSLKASLQGESVSSGQITMCFLRRVINIPYPRQSCWIIPGTMKSSQPVICVFSYPSPHPRKLSAHDANWHGWPQGKRLQFLLTEWICFSRPSPAENNTMVWWYPKFLCTCNAYDRVFGAFHGSSMCSN